MQSNLHGFAAVRQASYYALRPTSFFTLAGEWFGLLVGR